MRRLVFSGWIITALLACNKSNTDKPRTEVPKSVEQSSREPVAENRELDAAKQKLDADIRERLGKIEIAIAELDTITDPKTKETVAVLDVGRVEILRNLDDMANKDQTGFDTLERTIETNVQKLETEVNQARTDSKPATETL